MKKLLALLLVFSLILALSVTLISCGDETPPEDPPAENPPEEDPPSENPPTENPPSEDPPKEDPIPEEPEKNDGIFLPEIDF